MQPILALFSHPSRSRVTPFLCRRMEGEGTEEDRYTLLFKQAERAQQLLLMHAQVRTWVT